MDKTRLLIVEPDKRLAKDLKARLRALGYTVAACVASGTEALPKARRHKPDLALLDPAPGDGSDAAETAAQLRVELGLPVVYLVPSADKRLLRRLGAATPFNYVLKPFPDRELQLCIEAALDRQRTEVRLRTRDSGFETALARSEERFRLLAEHAQDLIYRYRLAPTPGFEYVSPSAAAITGYTPEEHYADPQLGHKIVHPPDRVLLEEALAAPQTVPQPLVLRWHRKDGNLIWTEQRISPVYDPAGALVAIEGIVRDVTERKLAEDALLGSEEKFRQIIQQMPYPVEVCARDGTAVLVNPAFLAMFGLESPDGLLGKYNVFRDPLPERHGYRDAVDRAFQGDMVFVPEITLPLEELPAEYGGRRKGTLIEEATMFPVLGPTGTVRQVVTIWKDITERKRAEEEGAIFAALASRLAAANSVEGVATIVAEESDRLLGWDAHYLGLRRADTAALEALTILDTVDGTKVAYGREVWRDADFSDAFREVFAGRAILINRGPGDQEPPMLRWGNKERPSSSLLWSPVRSGDRVIGVISAQSYTPGRYGDHELEVLQRFADLVAPALERAYAEEALRETNETLKAIIQASPLAVTTLDPEGRVMLWNPAAERIFGWREPEALGQTAPFVPPDKLEEFRALRDRVMHGEALMSQELQRRRKDGSPLGISLSTAPLRNAAGAVVGILGIMADITARKSAEEELRLKALLLDNALDSIFLHDLEGNFVYVNEAAYRTRGYTHAELMKLTLRELDVPEYAKLIEPRMRELMEKGEATFETAHYRKDGSLLPVDVHTRLIESGGRKYILSAARDLTERKHAEETLRASEETERWFSTQLKALHEARNQLLKADSLDEMCRRAVEIAVERLGFERLAIWFVDKKDPGFVLGSYGVDERGRLRDERGLRCTVDTSAATEEIVSRGKEFLLLPDAPLFNHRGEVVGRGAHALAPLLDGEELLGYVSVDNLLRHGPIPERQCELLRLYATTLSHRCTRLRAEAALRQSELQYRTTTDALADALHVVDPDLRIVLANATFRQWCRELGLPVELVGRSMFEVFPFLPDGIRDQYLQVFKTGKPLYTEEATRVNARELVTETRKIPVFEQGKVARIVTVVRDITERKQAENAVRESQARFQELFDDAPVGYHELDTEGRLTRVNRTELAMLGYRAEELLGRPVWDFIVEADVSRQAFAAKIAGTLPAGEGFERTFRRKDGTTLPVLVSERLLRDASGRIVGLRITNQDITARKRAETALQESEAKFRGLAETVPAAIFILRGDRFVYLNTASLQVTGYAREELAALDIFELVHPEDRELVRARSIARLRGGPVSTRYEFRILTRDGETRWLDFAASLIDFDGAPAVLATAYDITERKTAEEAVREALGRFESVVERTPLVAIQGIDAGGVIRHWNKASEWLYGFSAAEAVGRRFQDFMIPSEGVTDFEIDLAQIWATGEPTPPQQWPVRNRKGEELWIYSSMFPVFEGGAVAEVFAMDVDITERIRAERALHYRLGFENLIASISTNFLSLAPEEIDRGVNGALEALGDFLGVDRTYLFQLSPDGRTLSNTHEWCGEGIEPHSARLQNIPCDRFAWFLNRIRQLEIVHLPRIKDLPPDAANEREEFERESIQSLIALPLVYRGTAIGFFGLDSVRAERRWPEDSVALLKMVGEMLVNALEHKRVEELERHSRQMAEAIATASLRYLETGGVRTMAQLIVDQAAQLTDAQAGVLIDLDTDSQPRIMAVSARTWEFMEGEIYDRARQELETQGFCTLPLGDSLVAAPLRHGESILTNAPAEHPFWAGSMPAGHPPIDSFLATPIRVGGEVFGLIALANRPGGFTDRELREAETFANTAALALRMARSEQERLRAEEQLRQALKMEAIGRLAGGIAHDFNNLLTAILGYANLGFNSVHPSEHVHHYFLEIQHAADRAAALTRQLLAFSRRQPLEPRVVDLNEILLDMDNMLRRLIGEDVELVTQMTDHLGAVQVDPTQLEQVIVNLAINSRDAMPEGGRLILETANVALDQDYARAQRGVAPGDYVLLAISDTGTGMTDEVKAHLFEPFFTTKEVGKGTGLGLATSYGIIKQSGGHITAYSEPGLGTTFKIYFPRVAQTPDALPRRDETGYLPRGTETILLVEDEEAVRTLTARILEELGYTLLKAANGEEALRVVRENPGQPIHLLLTDVVMPQMGGKALAEQLRADTPDLKVLFMSGYSDIGIAQLGLTKHGTAFLQKPFTPGILARKLRETLDVPVEE